MSLPRSLLKSTHSALVPALVAAPFLLQSHSNAMRPPTEEEKAALPQPPKEIASSVLAAAEHPRLLRRADLERGRRNVAQYDWAKEYLHSREAVCQRFLAMSDDALRALVPKPGSLFVMGLAMNLDPVHKSRMRWAGWNDPFAVVDLHSVRYPNAEWPDDGRGTPDPQGKARYFFVALANAAIVNNLEREVLPALADVHALTGNQRHARVAAVLLDALAAAYPTSVRGPIDYPMGKELRRYGGRLDRPTQQVARGVANYAQVIDLIAASGELEKPSLALPKQSMRENIARNLLWDGASYCLLFCRQIDDLGNGMADFNYGAAAAGLLLGEPEFARPLTTGEKSLPVMLRQNLTRQGFYYEASPGYEFFTLNLYARSAELIDALREARLCDTPSIFAHPGAARLFTAPFQKREVGGHIPLLGNTRVDTEYVDPAPGAPTKGTGTQAQFQRDQFLTSAMVATRGDGKSAALARDWLHRMTGKPAPFADRWLVYHYEPEKLASDANAPATLPEASFDGGKGMAFLRGGTGKERHGAQLFFGPSQVKSQNEALTWTFFHNGVEWSFDPGRFNAHFRFGWCASSVAHQSLVVDRTNVDMAEGEGSLLSFGDDPQAQWALATHPGAYRAQGVTRFERFVAQVQEKEGGDLLYWLDVGRIEGGTQREESFHTQMQQVAFESAVPWEKAGPALHGEEDLGQAVLGDYRLRGSKEGFYWSPPGEGYGFLGQPESAPRSGSLRTVWSSPAFSNNATARLIVDFPEPETAPSAAAATEVKREWILARGPKAVGHPSVPYLLRSDLSPAADKPDAAPASSLFAKVLHFETGKGPKIRRVHPVPVDTTSPLAGSWLVERADGKYDLWLLNHKSGENLQVKPPGLPAVLTDALVAWVQFDAEGKAIRTVADGATQLTIEGGPHLKGEATLKGRIEQVQEEADGVRLKVQWKTAPPFAQINAAGYGRLARCFPSVGHPSTWSVSAIRDEGLLLDDASVALAGGKATLDEDGWIVFPFSISRFIISRDVNTRFAVGKPLYAAGKQVGRIAAVREDGCAIKTDRPLPPAALRDLEIREIAESDTIVVPLRLFWQREESASTDTPAALSPPH